MSVDSPIFILIRFVSLYLMLLDSSVAFILVCIPWIIISFLRSSPCAGSTLHTVETATKCINWL